MISHSEDTFNGADGISLYYQFWRPEQAPRGILVIVHGLCGHSGLFPNLVEPLTNHNFAVYTFDLRGHGHSPGQRGHIMSWREYRQDLGAFLQLISTREPGIPVFLFGDSLGAAIVLDYILQEHEGLRGAAIDGAPIQPTGSSSPGKIFLARLLSPIAPATPIPFGLDINALSRDPAFVQGFSSDPLVHDSVSVRWGTEVLKTIEYFRAHASQINLPMLILHGEADHINSAEGARWLYEQITYPDKELHIYPGVYHLTHNDYGHEQVAADLEAWMARHL
jgi:alpha-beta hydrolase superfamily lysophospholipase